jgi:hypothetical protein
MQLAAAILVILSHAGYWVGGQEQTVELRWPVQQQMPDAVVAWNLSVARTTLAEGKVNLPGGEGRATITITPPTVRAATELLFSYRVIAGDKELAKGETPVRLYPEQLADLAAMTAETPLLVIDTETALPATLKAAGVKFDRHDDLSGLAAANQKVIVVGAAKLAADDPAAAAVQALARGGASVLVLRQTSGPKLMEYELAERDVTGYAVEADHPLLRHLGVDAWKSLLTGRQPAIQLPADHAALELIHSPVEAEAVTSAPLDVLVMTQTLGSGRIVYCQLPLDRPASDARQQQLLINLIEYAKTRVQPTPSRAERIADKKKPATEKTQKIIGE